MPSPVHADPAGCAPECRFDPAVGSEAEPDIEKYPLWHRFGLSRAELAGRQHFLGLERINVRHLLHIQSVIAGSIDPIIAHFYTRLERTTAVRAHLGDELTSGRLRKSMRRYLLSLGASTGAVGYVEDRLRIGVVHERIGLPQRWYLGSMALLFEIIAQELVRRHDGPITDLGEVFDLLHKLLFFDSMLIVDTYTEAAQQYLKQAVERLRVAHEQLEITSRLDGLTGILHRRALMESLESAMGRDRDAASQMALLLLDVDHFKRVNDTWGHRAGDHVLQSVVRAMQSGVRTGDIVGRYGGEEFAVGLPAVGAGEAAQVAERVRRSVLSTPVELPGNRGRAAMTVSVGVACVAHARDSLDELIERADRALLQAKRDGRNRVCVAYKEESCATRIVAALSAG